MKLIRILPLLSLLFSVNIFAVGFQTCSENDVNYIRQLFNSNELTDKNASNYMFKIDSKYICVVKNELMMDGLSFTLYKSGEDFNFVIIHNGLDDSFKMYGPFERKITHNKPFKQDK
jgi:hypothetical protein